jgi:hypothetical protein
MPRDSSIKTFSRLAGRHPVGENKMTSKQSKVIEMLAAWQRKAWWDGATLIVELWGAKGKLPAQRAKIEFDDAAEVYGARVVSHNVNGFHQVQEVFAIVLAADSAENANRFISEVGSDLEHMVGEFK